MEIIELKMNGCFRGNATWEAEDGEFERLKNLSYDEVKKDVERQLEYELFDNAIITDLEFEFKEVFE